MQIDLVDRFRKRYTMQNVIARNGVVARRSRSKPEKIPHFVRNRLRNLKQPPESPFVKGDIGGCYRCSSQ